MALKYAKLHKFAHTAFGLAVSGSDVYVVTLTASFEWEVVKLELNPAHNAVEHEEALAVNAGEHALTVDPAGNVYVLEEEAAGKSHVAEYASPVTAASTPEEFGAGEIGETQTLAGIAYSALNGDVYVGDDTSNEVHIFAKGKSVKPPTVSVTPFPKRWPQKASR